MTYADPDGEGTLELNTMELFTALGWEVEDCYHETFGTDGTLGRETSAQIANTSSAVVNPRWSTRTLMSSTSRRRAASTFIASRCRGEAADTLNPG